MVITHAVAGWARSQPKRFVIHRAQRGCCGIRASRQTQSICIRNADTVRAMAEFERLWQNEGKQLPSGEVVERLNTPVLKTGILERVSGVRIPPSPPVTQ